MKVLDLYIMLLLLGCLGCKTGILNPKEEIPAATQEGLNTFGCLVNGEVWVPKAPFLTNKLIYEFNNGFLRISAHRITKELDQSIGIRIEKNLEKTGVYSLTNYPQHKATFFNLKKNPACFYEPNAVVNGELTIENMDTVNYIISGKFNFTVAIETCDTIIVTDGRFDIKYRQ